jgi:hypothetical protein
MRCPGLWSADTSLLFNTGRQRLSSTRCSPATSSCTSSWYNITSNLQSGGRTHAHGTVQILGVLPTFRKSSPSFKLLTTYQSTIWWTDTCPWHGLKTTSRLLSSTMLGACLLQSYSAIYSQSQTSGRWLSDDTVSTWSRGPADMRKIFVTDHPIFVIKQHL